jgi:bifunctional DNA-binding transcriptional regulator/antitoxin component of YhaV-PrlF toxin-antitoxin module
MQGITTITTKGQVTVPAVYRRVLGLLPSTRVKFGLDDSKRRLFLEPVADFSAFYGFFKTRRKYSKVAARKVYLPLVLKNKV